MVFLGVFFWLDLFFKHSAEVATLHFFYLKTPQKLFLNQDQYAPCLLFQLLIIPSLFPTESNVICGGEKIGVSLWN